TSRPRQVPRAGSDDSCDAASRDAEPGRAGPLALAPSCATGRSCAAGTLVLAPSYVPGPLVRAWPPRARPSSAKVLLRARDNNTFAELGLGNRARGRSREPCSRQPARGPEGSEADDVGHLPGLRGLVGRQDHAQDAGALALVVDRALARHQGVHEVRDLGREGVHALVLEDLLLLAAHVHAQGGAVGAERALLADHGEAVGARG